MADEYLTRPEACEILGVSATTIKKLEADGKLFSTRGYDKKVRYLKADIVSLVNGIGDRIRMKKMQIRAKEKSG